MLRIGVPSPALADWLKSVGSRHFAVLTAYNPASCPLPPAVNAERQAILQARLAAGSWPLCAGVNRDPAGEWPDEPSLLVAGMPLAMARALAGEFGQNALVYGDVAGVPHLVWINENR